MTVYVEYVFLVNFAANITLSAVTLRVLRYKLNIARIFFSAVLGAAAAVLYAYYTYHLMLKLLLSFVMMLFLFRWQNLKQYLKALPIFYLVSALFAGGAMFFNEIGWGEIAAKNGSYDISPLLTAVAFVAMTFITEGASEVIYRRKKIAAKLYSVEVTGNGKTVKTQGFFDTGNTLSEDGFPIVVLSKQLHRELQTVATGTIPVMTVAGIKILPSLNVTVKIYYRDRRNRLYQAQGVVSDKPLKAPLILNSEFEEEL